MNRLDPQMLAPTIKCGIDPANELIDNTIRAHFRQGVKLFYDTHETRTLKETFERTLVLFFHQEWESRTSVMVPILPPVEELPTLAQFQYWYQKEHV